MSWHDNYRVWLTETQSLANAQKVVDHFYGNTDWSRESICALVGNMRHESSINPDMYEYGYLWSADRGYGLVQWTPRSKYWNWAVARGKPPRDGDSQLDRIDYEVANNIQWIPRADYGRMTFAQFRANTGDWSIDYLTEAFTWGYERPNAQAGWNSMPDRKAFARLAYRELDWSGTGDGGGGDDDDDEPGEPGDPGDDTGGSSITYVESQGDIMFIHIDNGDTVTAYPSVAQRWIAEPNSFSSTGDTTPPDDGDDDDDDNGGTTPTPGEWTDPLDNHRCTNRFGPLSYTPFHYGIDLGAKTPGVAGDPMYAMNDYYVERTGGHNQVLTGHSGYGIIVNYGEVNGDTIYAYYGHNDSNVAAQGSSGKAGDIIARMGGTGANHSNSDFAVHLHLTMWKNDKPNPNGPMIPSQSNLIDPEQFFSQVGIMTSMNTCPYN